MADTIKYGMGQLRYVNSSSPSYMINKNFTTRAIKTLVASSSESETSDGVEYYQDVYLSGDSNFNFVAGTPYLLHLDIPKDLSYDCIYQIKLITDPGNNPIDTTNLTYQMIKYITVPKAVGVGNTSRIILYPITDDGAPGINSDGSYDLKVAIAKLLSESPAIGDIIYDESTGEYYIYDGPTESGTPVIGNSIKILNKKDTIMEHTWSTLDIKTDAVGFDIIFTSRSSNATYNGILIQMQRSALDYDIYTETASNGGIFGRKIDITAGSNWNATVYELTNLVGNNNVPTPLINIGVYSHPNLLMAINGQEIRVGQSGYYELNDFEITSLAIAASDINDKFTLDYQYKTTD